MKKTGWDELDDIDDLLKADRLEDRRSNVSIAAVEVDSDLSLRKDAVDVDSSGFRSNETKNNNSETLGDATKRKRRRSAIVDDNAAAVEVKAIGYDSRSQRLADQDGCLDATELTESNKNEFNRLLAKGVYLLGMREHSVKEMVDKLNARSDESDVVLAVVDELLENSYLSNERFAESYVRSRRNKGVGPVKIRVELKSKGVGSRLVAEYLQSESPEWIDVAREQYEKKYRDRVKDYKEWTKRARFMQGRGFTMEHIQAVLPSADFY